MSSRGITVNAIAPGIIKGSMTQDIFDEDYIKKTIPAGRAGEVEEVAALVSFLASDSASYISGQVMLPLIMPGAIALTVIPLDDISMF
jgi:3-oxoacyl-[acyl-carrier protein] reductase